MSRNQASPRQGDSTYVLGHSDAEIQRLLLQGQMYNDHTTPTMLYAWQVCGPDAGARRRLRAR